MASAINDRFRVAVVGSCFGQRIMLTHCYAITSQTIGASDAVATTALLDQLRAGGGADIWEALYLDCLPAEYQLDYWYVQKDAPVRVRAAKVTRAVPGTHANPVLTANLAATITFNANLAGRPNLSTKHIGPLPDGAGVTADGEILAAYDTKLSALANGMMTQITAGIGGIVFDAVIPHPAPAGSWTLIAGQSRGTTVRVMRRRTVRVGI